MGLKDDVVGMASEKAFEQDHRAPCLQQHARMSFGWHRASHFVVVFVMDVLDLEALGLECVVRKLNF